MKPLTTILILLAVVATSNAESFDCNNDSFFKRQQIAKELREIREQREEEHRDMMDAIESAELDRAYEAEQRGYEEEARWYDAEMKRLNKK